MFNQQIIVEDMAHLHAVQNHIPGELAYVQEDAKIFTWDEDEGWVELNIDNKGIDFNLYELNKNVINQLEPMTHNDIAMSMKEIMNYYYNTNNIYHMLLCRDFNYYTIFNYDSMLTFPDFAGAVCTIITELGEVYSIEKTEDGAMEIWIKPEGENMPYAFYLFPYDAGVVYYG